MQGTWAVSARPEDSVTVLEGLRAAAGDHSRVLHAKGANIVDEPNLAARLNVFGATFAVDARSPAELIAEAVALARQADVVVASVGAAKAHAGESSTPSELGLPRSPGQFVRATTATAQPPVLVTT